MTVRNVFLSIIAVYLTGFLLHALFLGKTVFGDGIFYYSWARSIVFDGDVNFADEYRYFGVQRFVSPLGIPGNKYAVGPALFWIPMLVTLKPVFGGSGYEITYQIAAGLVSVMAAVAGLIFIYLALADFFPKNISLLAISGIAGATNLIYYGSLDPVNSHALSFFVSAVLTYVSVRTLKSASGPDGNSLFLSGLLIGMATDIRLPDAVLATVILPFVSLRLMVPLLCGYLIGFSPQILAWKSVYGSFLALPYVKEDVGFDFFHPQVFGVLFSPNNGVFLWTPIVLFMGTGLFIFAYHRRELFFRLLPGTFLLVLYVISSWRIWWQGASYSGRMFISVLPLLGFGLAEIWKRTGKKFSTILTIILISANGIILSWYLFGN